jgi:hypothetical protein
MAALAKANRVRLARAALKRRVRSGDISVGSLLAVGSPIPYEAESMPIAELLGCQVRWGKTRVRKYLAALSISGHVTLAGLTDRQRKLILEGPPEPDRKPPPARLNGPGLVAWLEERRMLAEDVRVSSKTFKGRFQRWRRGASVTLDTADHTLLALGLHLSELPAHLYLGGEQA